MPSLSFPFLHQVTLSSVINVYSLTCLKQPRKMEWQQCHIIWSVKAKYFLWRNSPYWARSPWYLGFAITLSHIALNRIPLDEWSVRRRNLDLITHIIQKRQTCVPPAGFEPTIPARERSQNHSLESAATGIVKSEIYIQFNLRTSGPSILWFVS